MHRYIVESEKKCGFKGYMLVTANNLKEAHELVYSFNHKIVNKYDYFSVKMYTGQSGLMEKVHVFISKKWIKFKNE